MDLILTILKVIWTLFLVVMVFNLMIIVHEYGHFLAARWRGLVVDRFQIWFGKPLWKKEINGVQYGLGSIPAGGFVSLPQMVTMESIEGEVDDESKKELPPISPLDKIIVAFAGPLFSFLLAFAFALLVWKAGNPVYEASSSTVIGAFHYEEDADGKKKPNAAEASGLKVYDKILEIDGNRIDKFMGMNDSVMWAVISSKEDILKVKIDRPGEGEMTLDVNVPRPPPEELKGNFFQKILGYLVNRAPLRRMGIYPAISPVVADTMPNGPVADLGLEKGDVIVSVNGEAVRYSEHFTNYPREAGKPITIGFQRGDKLLEKEVTPRFPDVPENYERTLTGIKLSRGGKQSLDYPGPVDQVLKAARSIKNMLGALFTPKSGVSASHLNGPVGIMGVYYDLIQSENGWKRVFWFSVLLNVNLGILNLLPFPVLDGGHIVMAGYEWIRKKPIPLKVLEWVQGAFVLFLFGFMIFVSFKDVGDRVPKGEDPNAEMAPAFLSEKEKAAYEAKKKAEAGA